MSRVSALVQRFIKSHTNDEEGKSKPSSVTAPTFPSNREIQRNIELIAQLEAEAAHSRSFSERIADKITKIAGSAMSIVVHIFWFGTWILINVEIIPGIRPFDPYPFGFLTLVVSLEAIFLSLLVLLSQNRMIKESDKRAHLDLQLNMLAEEEGTMLLRLVEKIGKKLGVVEEDEEMHQLEEKTDIEKLERSLEENLPEIK